jgi:hypothetical protein
MKMTSGYAILLLAELRLYAIPDKNCGILDHTFIVGDVTWNVYVKGYTK